MNINSTPSIRNNVTTYTTRDDIEIRKGLQEILSGNSNNHIKNILPDINKLNELQAEHGQRNQSFNIYKRSTPNHSRC